MGGCCSSDGHHDIDAFDAARKRRQSSMGVGMGVAMMMQQAGVMVGGSAVITMEPAQIHNEIRRAKAEGRTVTIMNNNLYVDYHLVARVPPHYNISV